MIRNKVENIFCFFGIRPPDGKCNEFRPGVFYGCFNQMQRIFA